MKSKFFWYYNQVRWPGNKCSSATGLCTLVRVVPRAAVGSRGSGWGKIDCGWAFCNCRMANGQRFDIHCCDKALILSIYENLIINNPIHNSKILKYYCRSNFWKVKDYDCSELFIHHFVAVHYKFFKIYSTVLFNVYYSSIN